MNDVPGACEEQEDRREHRPAVPPTGLVVSVPGVLGCAAVLICRSSLSRLNRRPKNGRTESKQEPRRGHIVRLGWSVVPDERQLPAITSTTVATPSTTVLAASTAATRSSSAA